MKDDRLLIIVLFNHPVETNRKAFCPRMGWGEIIKKNFKEIVTSWEGVKNKALNRLGQKRSWSQVLGASVSC